MVDVRCSLLFCLFILCNSCKFNNSLQQASKTKEFINKQLLGVDFGIGEKELVLTLDDGPGPRTLELAKYLYDRQIPATFFMIGSKIEAFPGVIEKIAAYKNEATGNPLFIIANHSMSHTKALNSLGNDWAVSEIKDAHALIEPHVDRGYFFMRPPYGALAGSSGIISAINASGLDDYIGPVFWNIGGALTGNFAADWSCWAQGLTVEDCTQRYINEVNHRGKGIILMHDDRVNTVEMLVRSNGFIDRVLAAGYNFVPLDKDGEALQERFNAASQGGGSGTVNSFTITHLNVGEGVIKFNIQAEGAHSLSAAYKSNTDDNPIFILEQTVGASHDFTYAFLNDQGQPRSGSYFLEVKSYDEDGKQNGQELYPFTVAATITGNDSCVNISNLQVGNFFDVEHGANFQLKGKLQVIKAPLMVGSEEAQLLFELTYPVDRADKSKVAVNINTINGNIISGQRYEWSANPSIGWTISSSVVQCGSYPKRWEGTLSNSNGEEAFRITIADRAPGGGSGTEPEWDETRRTLFCDNAPEEIVCKYPALRGPNNCTNEMGMEFFKRANGNCQACSTVNEFYKKFHTICEYAHHT